MGRGWDDEMETVNIFEGRGQKCYNVWGGDLGVGWGLYDRITFRGRV